MKHPVRDLRRHILADLHYGLEHGQGKDWVAIILATAIATSMVFLVLGSYSLQFVQHVSTSDNTVELISTLIAGITAILGSYVGYRAISPKEDEPSDKPPT